MYAFFVTVASFVSDSYFSLLQIELYLTYTHIQNFTVDPTQVADVLQYLCKQYLRKQ